MKPKKYLTNPPRKWMAISWGIFGTFMTAIGYFATENSRIIWLMMVFLLLLNLLLVYTYWNYPILHEDCIEIKNLILFSFKYKYEDIKQFDIMNSAKGPIIIIKLKNKYLSRRFCIDAVDNKDLDNLAVDLLQRGVNTIRKGSPFD